MIGIDTIVLLRLRLNHDPARKSASTGCCQRMAACQVLCW
jgi:hypothetical protein